MCYAYSLDFPPQSILSYLTDTSDLYICRLYTENRASGVRFSI